MIVSWDDRLEPSWVHELGESELLLETVVGVKLRLGMVRTGLGVGVELGAGSDVRGDRGPKPSIGGFLGLNFLESDWEGICKTGTVGAERT